MTPDLRRSPRAAVTRAAVRSLHAIGLTGAVTALAEHVAVEPRAGRFPVVRRRRHRRLSILVYHRVRPRPDDGMASMELTVFRGQMECLARHFRVMSLTDAVEALRHGELPPRAVVITFDDGYADNFEFAFPVLRDLGLPATVFLVAGFIGTPDRLWHDRMLRALRTTTRTRLEGFGPDRERFELGPADRAMSERRLLRLFRVVEVAERDRLLDDLIDRLEVDPDAGGARVMLNWDEVRVMREGGIEFGAHTVRHPILTQVPVDEARDEIAGSKREIERRLGAPVDSFAYPNGSVRDFDDRIKAIVRDEGYACAVTTVHGANDTGPERACDLYALRRAIAEDVDPATFAAKLNHLRIAG